MYQYEKVIQYFSLYLERKLEAQKKFKWREKWEDPEKQRLLGVGIQEKPTRREMRGGWMDDC